MKIYQVWDSNDAAETDSFLPTKKEAMALYRQFKDEGGTPEMRVHELKRTDRQHICLALKFWPMR